MSRSRICLQKSAQSVNALSLGVRNGKMTGSRFAFAVKDAVQINN